MGCASPYRANGIGLCQWVFHWKASRRLRSVMPTKQAIGQSNLNSDHSVAT
jgi:hypothetical protein